MSSRLRRVLPEPAEQTTVEHAYFAERIAPAGRPWVGLTMISSLDGAVAIDGKSGALGNDHDRAVLATLRGLADVILVGAGTAAGEGYGAPSKAGLRIAVVTNSGSVDIDRPLFTSGAGFLVAPESASVPDGVEVLRAGTERVDLALALGSIDSVVPGARHVQAEGGPTLNGALLALDLIDELDLTLSPRLVGGDAPRVIAHGPQADARFELAQLLADDDGFLFGRWLRTR